MKFGVLGPLEVAAGQPIAVGGQQLRRLLAALLLAADRAVSADRLTDIVFRGRPTDAAATTLRSYVARLRHLLVDDGSGVAIETVSPGYQLVLGSSTVDAHLFEALVATARREATDGALGEAVERFEEALQLWRGPAYAEFADEVWAHLEALRLDEMRLSANELRLQTMVAAGGHDRALSDLRSAAETNPLREPTWASWTLALYRSGRQAEALRIAERFGRACGEVGLDPSPEFRELTRKIAAHDPSIRSASPPPRRLRGYRVLAELGRGRHGEVLRARQPGVERDVALRRVGRDIADAPDFIRRFDTLMQQVGRLENPHVVHVYDFWREPGAAYLVTRLLLGGSLAGLIDKGPAPADLIASIVDQVSTALAAAHRAGLAHGALTGREILFDGENNTYVDGIGVTAALDDIVGLGRRADDRAEEPPAARDQYALATLAYQALTGAPASGATDRAGRFPLVSARRPELLALDGVLARAGAAVPEDRYTDLLAFAHSFAGAVGRATPAVRVARRPATNPYKGLRAFGEADAEDFFGRDSAVEHLLSALAAETSFVTVLGASGSGKTSVVRAGLLPRLRRGAIAGSEDWFVTTMLPGTSPFVACAEALSTVASGPMPAAAVDLRRTGIAAAVRRVLPAGAVLLLVIDQLEELFTLTADAERRAFIDELVRLAREPAGTIRVLTTLRADFYDRPLAYHGLGELVAAGAVPLVGMSAAELEQSVVGPAQRVGISVEPSLAAQLVAEVANQPGALPLLQFCLTELFEERRSNALTLADFDRLGGVGGAVAERAEATYAALGEDERATARGLFLRLVSVDSDQLDLRRRTTRSELLSLPGTVATGAAVLERFGAARLLTFDHDPTSREQTVEVAHEALLRSWPRLREWIRAEGRGLEIRAGLTAAARGWIAGGRDDGDLYRGARLALAEQWADQHPGELTGDERDYLDASIGARDAERALERKRLAEQRATNRRLRRLAGGVGLMLVAALVLGGLAWAQWGRARDEAAHAERARGRALAAAAIDQTPTDRSLALLLAVEASRLDRSTQTTRAVLHALGGGEPPTRTVIPTPAPDYAALAVSSDERIAVGKRVDGSLDVVDLAERIVRHAAFPAPPRIVGGVDIDPTGMFVASSGTAASGVAATVHDLETGDLVAEIPGSDGEIHEVSFSPDGSVLAVAGPGGRIRLFDTESWTHERTIGIGVDRLILAASFTLDGTSLVVAAFPARGTQLLGPGRLYRVDIATGRVAAESADLDDGTVMTVTSDVVIAADTRIRAYRLEDLTPAGEPFGGTEVLYSSLAATADGIVAAGGWVTLELFDMTGEDVTVLPGPDDTASNGVAFVDDGRRLVTADADGSISAWDLGWTGDLGTALEPAGPGNVAKSPDGATLAVWGLHRGVRFFDRVTLAPLGELAVDTGLSILGVGFDPTGGRVVTLTCAVADGPECPATLTVWDVASGEVAVGPTPAGNVWPGLFSGAAFTGDGAYIVTAGDADGMALWDSSTLEPTGDRLALDDVAPMTEEVVHGLDTTSVDGRSLVVGGGELGNAVVWDVTGDDVQPLGTFGGNSSVEFLPGGQLVSASGQGTFRLLDPITRAELGAPFVTDLPAFWFDTSEDGLLVASGPWGSQMWEIESRQPISGVLASAGAVLAPDGQTVYLGGWGLSGEASGSVVQALSLRLGSLVELACDRAGRNLTAEEWARYMPAGEAHRATCPQWPRPTGSF